jgi:hypothetical protein
MKDQKESAADAGADSRVEPRAPWTLPTVRKFPMADHTQSAKSKARAAANTADDFAQS